MERSADTLLNLITLQKWVAACKLLIKNCSLPGLNSRWLEGIVWGNPLVVGQNCDIEFRV